MKWFITFWKYRVLKPLTKIIDQEHNHKIIALTLAIGLTLGLFPIIGLTTILCTFAALLFRLNMVAIHIGNLVIYPMWFICMLPYYKLGAKLYGIPDSIITSSMVSEIMESTFSEMFHRLGWLSVGAVTVWAISAPFLILFFRILLYPFVAALARAVKKNTIT